MAMKRTVRVRYSQEHQARVQKAAQRLGISPKAMQKRVLGYVRQGFAEFVTNDKGEVVRMVLVDLEKKSKRRRSA